MVASGIVAKERPTLSELAAVSHAPAKDSYYQYANHTLDAVGPLKINMSLRY